MARKIVIAATPTSPLLHHLIHTLTHLPGLDITVLTRPTIVPVLPHHEHSHSHTSETQHSPIKHIQTSFEPSDLPPLLSETDTLILTLSGSDLHFSFDLIKSLATSSPKALVIPSEFGLCTSNPKIRELLPPYQTRFNIQEELRKSGLRWKSIYTGVVLDEGMTTDGVLGLDCLWSSVVVFPHEEGLKVPISSLVDVSRIVGEVVASPDGEANEVFACGFRATLDEIVEVVEKELDRTFDRYEGILEGAKSEAKERFKLGFFDGGISLLARVAIWEESVGAWVGWEEGVSKEGWREEVAKTAVKVRKGEIGEGGGCGC